MDPPGIRSAARLTGDTRFADQEAVPELRSSRSASNSGPCPACLSGFGVADPDMLTMALHYRDQGLSLRDMGAKLIITTNKKKGQHPTPATAMRLLRDHDEQTTKAAST